MQHAPCAEDRVRESAEGVRTAVRRDGKLHHTCKFFAVTDTHSQIQRHHKRTPYADNSFPVEPYRWDCDDQGLYYYGQQLAEGTRKAARGYWQGYISDINPFVPPGWIGTCSFPQITSGGLDDSWQHGRDIYGVYHDLLAFLPSRSSATWRNKVLYRVTNNVITSQVAGMLISGTWGTTDSIPLTIQAKGVDSLEPQYSCSAGSLLYDEIRSSSNIVWKEHLDAGTDLFSALDEISGVLVDDEDFHTSFDHYFDNLSARQCHAKPLPCKLADGHDSTDCVDQELADAVYRMGQWEYSQVYRDAATSLAASVALYGVWIAELSAHLRDVATGKEDMPLYVHNIAHDGSTSRVLSILQIDVMVSQFSPAMSNSTHSGANANGYCRYGLEWEARLCSSCIRSVAAEIHITTQRTATVVITCVSFLVASR